MTHPMPEPRDFTVDFTPNGPADLELWVVDERPPAPGSLRWLARRARHILRGDRHRVRTTNDGEAERAWADLGGSRLVSPDAFAAHLRAKFAHDPLRKFEYPFLVSCLTMPDVRTDVIVDMGGGNSYSTVVPIVLRLPSARILSVDVVNQEEASQYGAEYIRGDCIDTTLPAESADVVTLISTLEHVGLGRWGDPLDVDGDIKAVREAWRILRPGGHLVLTIPYGYPTVVFNLHRIYDAGRVGKLAEGFDVVRAEYTMDGRSCTREEIEGQRVRPGRAVGSGRRLPDESAPQIVGGAMFLFRKRQ